MSKNIYLLFLNTIDRERGIYVCRQGKREIVLILFQTSDSWCMSLALGTAKFKQLDQRRSQELGLGAENI